MIRNSFKVVIVCIVRDRPGGGARGDRTADRRGRHRSRVRRRAVVLRRVRRLLLRPRGWAGRRLGGAAECRGSREVRNRSHGGRRGTDERGAPARSDPAIGARDPSRPIGRRRTSSSTGGPAGQLPRRHSRSPTGRSRSSPACSTRTPDSPPPAPPSRGPSGPILKSIINIIQCHTSPTLTTAPHPRPHLREERP